MYLFKKKSVIFFCDKFEYRKVELHPHVLSPAPTIAIIPFFVGMQQILHYTYFQDYCRLQ